MSEQINREIIAKTQGCISEDALAGSCCTNGCQYRDTCNIKRIKLIIPTITLNTSKNIAIEPGKGIDGITTKIKSMKPDGYLNEHAGMIISEDV